MKPVQTAVAGRPTTKAGAHYNILRRDVRSLAPRHVPGAYVSHTSEGVQIRPKATASDEGTTTVSVIPRWG